MEQKKSKTVKIVASIIAIVVILAIIFHFTNNTVKTNTQITTTSSQDNWKKYENVDHGFVVSYPSTYSIFHQNGDTDTDFRSTTGCEVLLTSASGTWPTDCMDYSISVQSKQPEISGPGYATSTITEAGYPAVKVVSPTGLGNWEGINQETVWFQKGANWYIQTFTFSHSKVQYAQISIDEILKSFSFRN